MIRKQSPAPPPLPSSRAKRRKGRRSIQQLSAASLERLEDRSLLAADSLATPTAIAAMIQAHQSLISGVTVVTHGYQPTDANDLFSFLGDGDSLQPLARAIRNRADAANGSAGSAWLLDYDVRDEGLLGGFDLSVAEDDDGTENGSITTGTPNEIVLLFDWAPESNEPSTGWGEAAGDALFSMLVGLGLVSWAPEATHPALHFIAHSFGSAVTSEAIERLAAYQVAVDHVTYLDPHDFDETAIPVDEDQRLFDLGQPTGYGATVWRNVSFADVYYQTDPESPDPEGRPLVGAHNTLVNAQVDDALIPHGAVWNDFYQQTVTDTSPASPQGYAWSRVAGGSGLRPAADFNFYSAAQDHEHTPAPYRPVNVPWAEREAMAKTRSAPLWSPLEILVNGDFAHAGDEYDDTVLPNSDNLIPGWTHHGGGGDGWIEDEAGPNYFLRLDDSGPRRTHNSFYLPAQAGVLQFDLRIDTPSFDNTLVVSLGDWPIQRIPLSTTTTGFTRVVVPIPWERRDQVTTLSFAIEPAQGGDVDSELDLDNISIDRGGRTGDVTEIDLKPVVPGESVFEVVGWDLVGPAGNQTQELGIVRNSLRGDDHLQLNGETVSYVLYSQRMGAVAGEAGQPFSSSGQLYLAPPTTSLSTSLDTDAASRGFQGTMRLWYRVGENPVAFVDSSVAQVVDELDQAVLTTSPALSLLSSKLTNVPPGTPLELSNQLRIEHRDIWQNDAVLVRQWLLEDLAQQRQWTVVATADRLNVYPARSLDFVVARGASSFDEHDEVPSNTATPLAAARLQQRLRYWNYPDDDGNLLVVDGIVGPHTRHAAGLFTASSLNTDFAEQQAVSGVAFNYINGFNGPTWQQIAVQPGDHFTIVPGPFPADSPPRYSGTEWLIETIRGGAALAKTGPSAISMPVAVGAISTLRGPAMSPYHHAGHDAGMSVDFVLPTTLPVDANGTLDATENEVVRLVQALEAGAFDGVTLREVVTASADIAQAINLGRPVPLAHVDPALAGVLHVRINAPPALTTEPTPEPTLDEEATDSFQQVLDWLKKLIDTELNKQIPAMVEASPENAGETTPATLAGSLGLGTALTGGGSSILGKLSALLSGGGSASPSQIAEFLSESQVHFFLNLPKTAVAPATPVFNSADPTSYNHAVEILVNDADGHEHPATAYFIKSATPQEWRVRLHVEGTAVGTEQTLIFSPQTGAVVSPTDAWLTFESYQPDPDIAPIHIRLNFDASHSNDDVFKSGWTSWGHAVEDDYDSSSGIAFLRFTLRGNGSTGDRQLDLTDFLDQLNAKIPHNLQASLSLDSELDFTIAWNTKSSLPLADTISLQLNEFGASFTVLVDTLAAQATIGPLSGQLIDTGTQQNPGEFNSYVMASAGFDVELKEGQPVPVGELSTLTVGEDYSLNITCDLDGVIFYETTLAGVPLPGSFWASLGLAAAKIVAAAPPVALSSFSAPTAFSLTLTTATGNSSYLITLPAAATIGNQTLTDLASDVNVAIDAALADTAFAGQVSAVAIGPKLAIQVTGANVLQIAVTDLANPNGALPLAQLGFTTGQSATVPSALEIKPQGDLADLLELLQDFDPKQLADAALQLGDWLSSLSTVGPFANPLPLGGGSFGKWGDLGTELKEGLLNKFQELLLIAEGTPAAWGNFPDATSFQLTVNDQTFLVTLPASVTATNTSLDHLAKDVSASIVLALDDTPFDGAVIAVISGGRLALRSTRPGVTAIRVDNAEEQGTAGVERMGFADGQSVDRLRLQTLQDFELMLAEVLGVPISSLGLQLDRITGRMSANVSLIRESLLGSTPITLGQGFGALAEVKSQSTIDLWRRAVAEFTLGLDLSPLGLGFQLSTATPLDTLPSWGKGIEQDKTSHLQFNLSNGSQFIVNLAAAQSIGDVLHAIQESSRDTTTNDVRVSATLNAAANGIDLTELTFSADDNAVARFTVAAHSGSKAGLILGLLGADDDDDGVLAGRELHGESLINRLYVEDFTAKILVQATAADIDASAMFGFTEVLINNGTGQATAEIELPLFDPDGDGRLYVSEMMAATNDAKDNADGVSLDDVLHAPELECSLNLELPIALSGAIGGLSLPATAAVIVTWQNIHQGTEPIIFLRDMDALKGFENFSGVGLHDNLLLDKVLEGAIDIQPNTFAANGQETVVPELRITFRDGSSPIAIDLDAIEPQTTGVARHAVRTFGDLRAAISGQTQGRATLDYSLDGGSLILNDNTEGNGSFSLVALNGSSVRDQLGLIHPASDGQIVGDSIYQPSVLDSLRRVLDLLRSFESLDALNEPIPGTTTSINDLLEFADRLETTLDELQENPVASLQKLEQALEQRLGLATNKLGLAYEGNALKIVFEWARSASQTLGLNFDLGGALGPLVDARGKAAVLGEASATFTLALGIDLTDPQNLRPFLYTNDVGAGLMQLGTKLLVGAKLSTPAPISMSASVGPLGVHIRNGHVVLDADGAGPSTTPAGLTARVRDTDGDGRRYLDELDASALTTTFVGAAAIHLPTYFPTVNDSVGPITLTAPNLLDPTSFTVQTPDFSAALANFNPTTDLSAFIDGWDGLLGLLETQVAKRLGTIKLPVIGNQLGDLTRFLTDLRDAVSGNIDPASLVSATAVPTLQNALFQQLSGLGFLRDTNGNGIDLTDVVVTQPSNSVEFHVSLGGQIVIANDLKFNLGLPGLGLKLPDDLNLSLTANFRFDVGVGIDKNQGVYIALAPNRTDDMHLDFRAQLTGGNLSANLGFLSLEVINTRTEAAAELDFDINPGSDGRLKLGEIFGAPLTTSFTGNVLEGGQDHNKAALVDWQLVASFNGAANLPKLRTDFDLTWTINSFNDLTKAPTISFGAVQLNLGSFLSDFLGPIVDQVNTVVEPVRPLLKVLTDPLPVISDLAGPTTLLDLADFFGYGDYNDFVYSINDLANLANSLQNASGANWIDLGAFSVDGKLALSSRGRGQLAPKPNLQQTFAEIQSQINTSGSPAQAAAFNQSVNMVGGGFKFPILENPASAFGLLLGKDVTLFGYDMPALQAQFEYSQFFPIFGPVGARITGSVGAKIDFAFGFDTFGLRQFASGGYETPGDIFKGFFISDTASVDGQGADVPEVTLSGALKAAGEIEAAVARAGVGGGVFLDVFFDLNDPSGDGKIRADELQQNFDLGPLHIFDVSGKLSAKLFAYYEIGFKVFGKYKRIAGQDWELAEVVLLDYTLPRPTAAGPPEFSRVEGGVLKFSTTEQADQFTVSAGEPGIILVQSQGREEARSGVTSILFEGLGGNDRLTVLEGVSVPLEAHGGVGDDQIIAADGHAVIYGDDGRDLIRLGSGGGTVDGGDGDDDITGSESVDIIYGGPGRDMIVGLGGNDQLYGQDGADRLDGGFGDDILFGGADNDYLDAGRGNDRVEGDAGDDDLRGGFDNDVLIGGTGHDRLLGDRGDDILVGDVATVTGSLAANNVSVTSHSGAGNDAIDGDRGDDLVYAGGGNDTVDAGGGNDTVHGQAGRDAIELGAGVDWADGGDDNDRIFGGAGSDTLFGGWGSDLIAAGSSETDQGATGETHTIFGDPTSGTAVGSTRDTIYGGRDDDEIDAGPGDDTIYARGGSDLIVGGLGKDRIFAGIHEGGGGAANDLNTIYGDAESTSSGTDDEANADTIYGDLGRDLIYAASGSDAVYALGGNNEIHLGAGHNVARAGSGADEITAADGNDRIDAGDGDNIIQAGNGHNRVTTGAGIDTITTGSGNDTIDAGLGGNFFQVQLINAGAGNNVITSSDGVDTITTLGGHDVITTRHGTKTIQAGDGDNTITAGNATLMVTTGSGRDAIAAGVGQKFVQAGNGNNTIVLGSGDAEIVTGTGNDSITTGDGNDRILAGQGNNRVAAGGGYDFVLTGPGTDTIDGGAGDDILLAGHGDDIVQGDRGRDLIVGDQGDDVLDGGDDEDILWGGLPDDAVAQWGIGTFSTVPTLAQIQQQFGWLTGFNPASTSGFGSFSWMTATQLATLGSFVSPNGFVTAEEYAVQLTGRPEHAAALITPTPLAANSVNGRSTGPGSTGDGADQIFGGEGTDWVFSGGDADVVDGGGGADYLDAGNANDRVLGGDGDDILRGGNNDDILRGGAGIDQLYGDAGSDLLFGDVGDTSASQAGQRLWGGAGFDTLYAFAPSYDSLAERDLWGDELIGGGDGDLLYGNLRRDLLIGDSITQPLVGADFLHGDYLTGPLYARSESAGTEGGGDYLLGGFGQDQLYGGGGPDVLYGGPDGDWLEGMDGDDHSYGGSGVDIMVLDVDSRYSTFGDTFDGHFGNNSHLDAPDDGAVDILLVEGDRQYHGETHLLNDRIWLSETVGVPTLQVRLESLDDLGQPLDNTRRDFDIAWRDDEGLPVIEQFQVSGLRGHDQLSVRLNQESIDQLSENTPGRPWHTVISGGPGNDLIEGSAGRDRIDVGPGSDIAYGYAGDDRIWGDFFNGDPLLDTDVLFGGQGNDDLIGGSGSNHLFAWSRHPDLDPVTATIRDFLTEGPSETFGIYVDAAGNLYDSPAAGRTLEDTGLNRMLGTSNPAASVGENAAVAGEPTYGDVLYGGTGLDFLYGNGGGGVFGDLLVTRHGQPFGSREDDLTTDDAWKAYAKSTDAAWYLAGSAGDDEVDIDYVTNPYNPLFGRHQVTFRTTGSFDPRFNGFDSFSAFDRDDQRVHSNTDEVLLADNVRTRPSAANPGQELSTIAQLEMFGATEIDIVERVFGPEADFLAIIIDTLDGNDTVTVGETVQKTVWVDAGAGDDTVQIQPQVSFLPDRTDPYGNRNDTQSTAIALNASANITNVTEPLTRGHVFEGLTFDSARSDEPDTDWYRFALADVPLPGDVLRIVPTSGVAQVNLRYELFDGNTSLAVAESNPEVVSTATAINLGGLAVTDGAGPKTYYLKIESVGAIPTAYEVAFELAHSTDDAEPNNSQDTANRTALEAIHHVAEVTGLTLGDAADEDWFQFDVTEPGTAHKISVQSLTPTAQVVAQIVEPGGAFRAAGSRGVLPAVVTLPTNSLVVPSTLTGSLVSKSFWLELGSYARLTIDGATGGTYTLSFNGQSTNALPYDATTAQIQAALLALDSFATGELVVSSFDDNGVSYPIIELLTGESLTTLTLDATQLVGATTAQLELSPARLQVVFTAAANTVVPNGIGVYVEAGSSAAEVVQQLRAAISGYNGLPAWVPDKLAASAKQNLLMVTTLRPATGKGGIAVELVDQSTDFGFYQAASDEYYLTVTGGPARYSIVPSVRQQSPDNNFQRESAYAITNLTTFQPERQQINPTAASGNTTAWFSVELEEPAGKGTGIGIRAVASLGADDSTPDLTNVLELRLLNEAGQVLRVQSMLEDTLPDDADGDLAPESISSGLAVLDFEGLATGRYYLQVAGATTTYRLPDGTGAEARLASVTNFEVYSTSSQRVQLRPDFDYGRNHKVNLAAAAAPDRRDVILGGTGNDRLAGGSGEDWIFGGVGNDVLTGGADQQAEDLLFGGAGDDTFQIITDALPINPRTQRPGDGATADLFVGGAGDDRVLYVGGSVDNQGDLIRDYVAVGYDRFLHRHKITTLAWDTHSNSFVQDPYDTDAYAQRFAFFKAKDIERTLIELGDGADTFHADPGLILAGQSWGIYRGDVEARATAFASIEVNGGLGNDWLYGGANNDLMRGGAGRDLIFGGEGDDILLGQDGDDIIAGNWQLDTNDVRNSGDPYNGTFGPYPSPSTPDAGIYAPPPHLTEPVRLADAVVFVPDLAYPLAVARPPQIGAEFGFVSPPLSDNLSSSFASSGYWALDDSGYATTGQPQSSLRARGGVIHETIASVLPESILRGTLVDASGRMLVSQLYFDISTTPVVAEYVLTRFLADGSVDLLFGDNGVAQLDGLPAQLIAASSDGGYYVASASTVGKLTSAGQRDPSLTIDLTAQVATAEVTGFQMRQLMVHSNGSLTVTGTGTTSSGQAAVVLRYLATGLPDASFSAAGIFTTAAVHTMQAQDNLIATALDSDNGLALALSRRIDSSNSETTVLRLTSAGQVATTFGTDGKATLNLGAGRTSGSLLNFLADNHLAVAGNFSDTSGVVSYPFVARLTNLGQLDTAFGSLGVNRLSSQIGYGSVGLVATPTNELRLAISKTDFTAQTTTNLVVGLDVAGNLAAGYADLGLSLVNQIPGHRVTRAHVAPDGRLVLFGDLPFANDDDQVGIVRILANGRDDASLGKPSASWTFTGLPDGRYAIYATWMPGTASEAAYYWSTDGSNSQPNGEFQTIDPSQSPDDRSWGGGAWEQVGLATVSEGTLRVFLTGTAAAGTYSADAVRLEPLTADAYAWDGATANSPLATFVGSGDINGDDTADYVFADSTKAYVFFGPVDPRGLFRVTTEDLNGDNVKDLRLRGNDWTYDITMDSSYDLTNAKNYYRISGRADVIYDVGAGPLALGNFDGDLAGTTDLAVLSGTNLLKVFYGGLNLPRTVTTVAKQLTVSTLASPQLAAANWNNDGKQDLIVFAGSGASTDAASGTVGVVYSGAALTAATPTATVLTTFTADTTTRSSRLTAAGLSGTHTVGSTARQFAIEVVGNVDGVAGDELLIVDRSFLPLVATVSTNALPNLARAYLLNGGPAGSRAINSRYVWEDYALAYPHAVGDVNQDGFIDFALSTDGVRGGVQQGSEPGRYDAGLYVLSGSTSYGTYPPTAADLLRGRPGSQMIASKPTLNAALATLYVDATADVWSRGRLYLQTGDFDGDGQIDFAVGQPKLETVPAGTTIYGTAASPDARGTVSVFFGAGAFSLRESIAGRLLGTPVPSTTGHVMHMSQPDALLTGEAANDQFGILPATPSLDLNGDRLADLLVAARGATSTIAMPSEFDADAGRIYVFAGSPRVAPIPIAGSEWLTNRDIPESGLYVVEQADGTAFRQQEQLFGTGLVSFANPDAIDRLESVSGSMAVANDRLQLSGTLATIAVSTLPETGTVAGSPQLWLNYHAIAKLNTLTEGRAGIVFDYRTAANGDQTYKFAGLDLDANRWLLATVTLASGETTAVWEVQQEKPIDDQQFGSLTNLRLDLNVETTVAVLKVNGIEVARHDFATVLHRGQVGLAATGTALFDDLSVTDSERWYRFSTLGDGQIGDVLKVRMRTGDADQEVETTSRAAAPQRYQSNALDRVRTALLGTAQPEIPTTYGYLTKTLTGWSAQTVSSLEVGALSATSEKRAIIEVDLSRFMSYTDDPSGIAEAKLTLPEVQFNVADANKTLTVTVLDGEADLLLTADDATAPADRFRNTAGQISSVVLADTVSAGATFDLTQQVRDALVAGRTRLTLRITSDAANTVLFAAPALADDPATPTIEQRPVANLEVGTAIRHGLVADVFDADGRRWGKGLAIMDLRNLPAGDYVIRVHDPFEDADSLVYRKLTAEGRFTERDELQASYRRDVGLKYTIEIEAPKIGDSHAVLDRDEIDGGLGNDFIQGNGYVDRILGGKGLDTFRAEVLEVHDAGRIFDDGVHNIDSFINQHELTPLNAQTASRPADHERSSIVARPIDFDVPFDPDDTNRTLENLIAHQLGIANFVTNDASQEFLKTRSLRASDLTRLLELDASQLWRTLTSSNGSALAPEYVSPNSVNFAGDIRSLLDPGDTIRFAQSNASFISAKITGFDFKPSTNKTLVTLGANVLPTTGLVSAALGLQDQPVVVDAGLHDYSREDKNTDGQIGVDEESNSTYGSNILSAWTDFGGNSAHYTVLAADSVLLKNTSASWVGYYPAEVLVKGNYTLEFKYFASTNGSRASAH